MRLFAKGDRVTQPRYGPGTIISTDEQYTVVEFDNHGQRRFITTMVTLEATKEPAPARAAAKRRKPAAKKQAETPTAS
jgi:DNA-binding FadR family transcriptional regulator